VAERWLQSYVNQQYQDISQEVDIQTTNKRRFASLIAMQLILGELFYISLNAANLFL
jgi:hypothetical protein